MSEGVEWVRLTWHQAYPGGRIVAKTGSVEVGAVFPFPGGGADWRFWLGSPGVVDRKGSARSELAAKSALLGEFATWCRGAGLCSEAVS